MTASTSPHVIGILEDSGPVRDHFLYIIDQAPDLTLGPVATTMAEAERLLVDKPALVLTDLGLPDGSGLDLIPRLKAAGIHALVLTAFGDRETVVAALEAGADGYLLKDSSTEEVLNGIRVTLEGGAPISAAAAVYLLERFRKPAPDSPAQAGGADRLTPREQELLSLFAKGHSYKSAARELGISPLTVGDHVKAIYRKLSVNSRGEAVFTAMQRGQLTL